MFGISFYSNELAIHVLRLEFDVVQEENYFYVCNDHNAEKWENVPSDDISQQFQKRNYMFWNTDLYWLKTD